MRIFKKNMLYSAPKENRRVQDDSRTQVTAHVLARRSGPGRI